jgi:hypothetical protein
MVIMAPSVRTKPTKAQIIKSPPFMFAESKNEKAWILARDFADNQSFYG